MNIIGNVFLVIVLILVIYIIVSCVRIVPQAQAYVIERLGAYNGTWSVGLHFKIPFIDRGGEKGAPEGAGSGFRAAAGDHQG